MIEHLNQENTSVVMTIAMRHPIVGVVTAVILGSAGYIVPIVIVDVPSPVMHWIQLGIWCLAGWASVLTIRGYYKKQGK